MYKLCLLDLQACKMEKRQAQEVRSPIDSPGHQSNGSIHIVQGICTYPMSIKNPTIPRTLLGVLRQLRILGVLRALSDLKILGPLRKLGIFTSLASVDVPSIPMSLPRNPTQIESIEVLRNRGRPSHPKNPTSTMRPKNLDHLNNPRNL